MLCDFGQWILQHLLSKICSIVLNVRKQNHICIWVLRKSTIFVCFFARSFQMETNTGNMLAILWLYALYANVIWQQICYVVVIVSETLCLSITKSVTQKKTKPHQALYISILGYARLLHLCIIHSILQLHCTIPIFLYTIYRCNQISITAFIKQCDSLFRYL